MLISSECVAQAPSRQVALAPSRRASAAGSLRPDGFGLDAVVRERGQVGLAVEAGWKSGIWSGGDSAAVGYLHGQLAGRPTQASPFQAAFGMKSAVQNSTDQHNNIQVTRLVPASRGAVGPHPVREPGPA